MTTITAFILARVAEDEARAGDERPPQLRHIVWNIDAGTTVAARVLAHCEALRECVEVLAIADAMDSGPDRIGTADHLLRALASIYADHPDYRAEWA